MKHELFYETQAAFNAAQGNSGNVTSITPGVAYIEETGTVPHFNKTSDIITVVYNVTDLSTPTKLYDTTAMTSNLKEIIVDKVHIPGSSVTNTYQFTGSGMHVVRFVYSSITTLPGNAFYNCTDIYTVKLPESISSFGGQSCFNGCSSMKKFTIPPKVHGLPNYTFNGCSQLEELHIGSYIVLSNNMFLFSGCGKLKRVYYNTLEDFFKTGWFRIDYSGESTRYAPCSTSKDGHLYINGEEVFDVVVPETVTQLKPCTFAYFRYIRSVTLHNNITSYGEGVFYYCTSLVGDFDSLIPSSVTTIGNYSFMNCDNVYGDLIFSENVRSIGTHSFNHMRNNNLGDVIVPSGVTYLGDFFLSESLFKNVTINSRGGNTLNNRLVMSVGDGTGDLRFNVDFLETGNNTANIYFKNFIFEGSYTYTWTLERILFNNCPNLKTIILKGDLDSNNQGPFTNGVSHCEYVYVGGTITNLPRLFYTNNSIFNGLILHLGYDGIATTPTVACASFARLAKIYVGDGSSEEHDQAILNRYLQDSDWAEYSDKLDLWYNYHGEYRQE